MRINVTRINVTCTKVASYRSSFTAGSFFTALVNGIALTTVISVNSVNNGESLPHSYLLILRCLNPSISNFYFFKLLDFTLIYRLFM